MHIATAATNHNTRHPLIYAGSWATTMHRLSGGRFHPGIGRGIGAIYSPSASRSDHRADGDFAQVMRRMWHEEYIFSHGGPIGKYQILGLGPDFREGHPAGAEWRSDSIPSSSAARVFDDVILHTYSHPRRRCSAVEARQGTPPEQMAGTSQCAGVVAASPPWVTTCQASCG